MKRKLILAFSTIFLICVGISSFKTFNREYVVIGNKIDSVYKDIRIPIEMRETFSIGAVEAHNNYIKSFPNNVYAYILGIKPLVPLSIDGLEALEKIIINTKDTGPWKQPVSPSTGSFDPFIFFL